MVLNPIRPVIGADGRRRLQSWIESFVAHTDGLEAAPLWRRWTAISLIASTLGRRVWVRTNKGDLFPNQYILLVGHPGTGKSVTIGAGEVFLRELESAPGANNGLHLAPTSLTMASLVDKLAEARHSIVRVGQTPPLVEYNSLIILSDELSALISTYDKVFMAGLTKIYDGGYYGESRRSTKSNIHIPAAQLNILAGTTPSNLCSFMPEGAWDQGFASRIVMVYSGDRHLSDIFNDQPEQTGKADYRDLLHDLQLISYMYGEMKVGEDAKTAFRAWRDGGELPVPAHPKLTHYCSRRTSHVLKLCMAICAARGTDYIINADDFELAKGWLIETELTMPDIFLAGKTGGDSSAMEETYHFVWAEFAKRKAPVPEHEVIHFVRDRVPYHAVLRTIEIMEREGSLVGKVDLKTGVKGFTPSPRKA